MHPRERESHFCECERVVLFVLLCVEREREREREKAQSQNIVIIDSILNQSFPGKEEEEEKNVVRRPRRLESRLRRVSLGVANRRGQTRTFTQTRARDDRFKQRPVFHAQPFRFVRVQIVSHHPRERRELFSAHARETTSTKPGETRRA